MGRVHGESNADAQTVNFSRLAKEIGFSQLVCLTLGKNSSDVNLSVTSSGQRLTILK